MNELMLKMHTFAHEVLLLNSIDGSPNLKSYKNVVFQYLLDSSYGLFITNWDEYIQTIDECQLNLSYQSLDMLAHWVFMNYYDLTRQEFDLVELRSKFVYLTTFTLFDILDMPYDLIIQYQALMDTHKLHFPSEIQKKTRNIDKISRQSLFLAKLAYKTIID